jgi:hypothetical protein
VLGVYPFLAASHAGSRPALNQFFNVFLLDAHIFCIALFLLISYKFTILSVSDKIQGGKDAKTFAMWRNPPDNKKGDRASTVTFRVFIRGNYSSAGFIVL